MHRSLARARTIASAAGVGRPGPLVMTTAFALAAKRWQNCLRRDSTSLARRCMSRSFVVAAASLALASSPEAMVSSSADPSAIVRPKMPFLARVSRRAPRRRARPNPGAPRARRAGTASASPYGQPRRRGRGLCRDVRTGHRRAARWSARSASIAWSPQWDSNEKRHSHTASARSPFSQKLSPRRTSL